MKVAVEMYPGIPMHLCRRAHTLTLGVLLATCLPLAVQGQGTQPVVAIHDSELTRALESMPATGATPSGTGTTGKQWWQTDWHYFVMPESLKEALHSDGTAFAVVGDSNITSGLLLSSGLPKYPIVISLAAEAMRDDEIAPLTNYVAAGGFLLVGSSAFTRNPDGTARGDFAFANAIGVHVVAPGLTNWAANNTFTKQAEHRLVSHIPEGLLTWRMPSSSEEIPWGISPAHPFLAPHDVWQVQASDATVIAAGDNYPYLLVKPYGKGYFIYDAAMQPLVGHGGFAPGMYSYAIFRKAVEWAFEAAGLPVPKLSPWPYAYDAAFMMRHDLENYQNEIADLELSAQFEATNGVKGDYYFCTGTLREDMAAAYDTNAVIASLRRAVSIDGATIGSHNGGLKNPNNPALVRSDLDYWHWGPDEALDVTPTNYASGKAYALASMAQSFQDVESWLGGLTNGLRAWVGCYFNSTREDSYDIQAQLGVNIAGEQKLTPFPHWTLSTRTANKRYPFVTLPVSDWYVGGLVAQSMEPWHPPGVHTSASIHDLVDFYYGMGGLINLYCHTLSTGEGDAGPLVADYITYSVNSTLHPRLWSANAAGVYRWWVQRSNATMSVSYTTNGNTSVTTVLLSGATHAETSIELLFPSVGSVSSLQVFTNGVAAGGDSFRTNGQVLKLRVGTAVTNAQVLYVMAPNAQSDRYTMVAGKALIVAAPGVLANDSAGPGGGSLTSALVSGPTNGTVALSTNGGFTYSPASGFVGTDAFTYQAKNGVVGSSPAAVTITVLPADTLFFDSFTSDTDPGALAPWVAQSGAWTVTGGVLEGGPDTLQTYGFAYTQSWTNYSVQARIQFPAGAYGGALGGRLNAATGAHYGAWIYPEGSAGGSSTMSLVKFKNWTTWGYNNSTFAPMQQVSLPGVGTGWHTVKLAFYGNQIAVWYDGKQMMSVTDVEAQPYLSGGISADMWTATTPYTMSLDDVIVAPIVVQDSYILTQNTTLAVPAPGVLANDSEVYGTSLAAKLISGPANGILSLLPDGSLTYLPATNFTGADSFAYQAVDGTNLLGTATVFLTVNPAPVLNTPPFFVNVPQNDALPQVLQCASPAGTPTNMVVTVADLQGNALQVIWVLNGTARQTNRVPATGVPATNAVSFLANLALGPNSLVVSVADGFFPPVVRTKLFTVVDTLPPVPDVASLPTLTGQAPMTITTRPTATDAGAGRVTGTTSDPLTYNLPGTNIVHWLYSDGHGNSATQLQTVIVKGAPPIITCPSNITVANAVPPVLCSFSQNGWGAPISIPGLILAVYFAPAYTNGFVEIGIPGSAGFSLKFTSAAAAQAYLPSAGAAGALTADATNPTSSSAGIFGGQVLALRLNVDFGDLGGPADQIGSIGDQVLSDITSPLNGKTVRQILAVANTALGGGDVSSQGLTIGTLSTLVDNLNQAYTNCQAGSWAAAHLLPAAAAVSVTGTPTVTDNYDPHPVVTYSDAVTPGTCAGSYTIARTWKAADAFGGTAACTQLISLLGNTASLSGAVMLDCNADGNLSGATGLQGVLVTLKTNGVIAAATATDANGAYAFANLRAAAYVVAVTPPANYQQTVDPDSTKDNQTVVNITSCQGKTGVNFGYAGTAPSLSFAQTGPVAARPGDTITYTFAVTNTGNTCFYGGLQVQDPMLGGLIFYRSPVSPGQGFVFQTNYLVKASDPAALVNTATAIGIPPNGNSVSIQAVWTVSILTAPAGLTATASNASVALKWSAATGATSYNVKRSTVAGGPYATLITGLAAANYTDATVVNGIAYYYVVSAVKAGIESPNSSPMSAVPSAGLPSPWSTRDIGTVGAVGSASYPGSVLTVIGSGADIWDVADEFRYVYQSASGDCSMVARVVGVQATDPWAKAGVMIRETLTANAQHASAFVTSANGIAFQYRIGTGNASGNYNLTGMAAPYWVKIVRSGNTFTSYRSPTGTNWVSLGSQTITMGANVYIGLAVTSHNDGVLCTATFDNVTATP